MSNEVKALLGLGVVAVVVIALLGYAIVSSGGNKTNSSTQILLPTSHKEGPSDAKVTLVEFGDYQCPACASAEPIVLSILQANKGKILFSFRNFPLTQHANAQISSEAAEAAGDQGKYFEMNQLLYEHQSEWSGSSSPMDFFIKYAQTLNLDLNKFKDDVNNKKFFDVITKDQNDGIALGINSTPTFFLNGEKLTGVPNQATLQTKIDALLK